MLQITTIEIIGNGLNLVKKSLGALAPPNGGACMPGKLRREETVVL